MFSVTIIIEEVNSELLIRMSALEIILIFNASIGLYVLQFLNVYRRMLEKCFAEIEKYLDDFHELSQVHISIKSSKNISLVERLQKLQRLYMCLRRNFQINEEHLQPGVIIIYTVDMCLLLIGYTYFAVLFVDGEVPILKFDAYVLIKSGATVLAFSYLCYEAQQVYTVVHEYRCINNKLFRLVVALGALELLNICFLFALKTADLDHWISIIASEISMIALIALLLYSVQNNQIYISLLKKCFAEIEHALSNHDKISLAEKLKSLQRLYMALRSNFIMSGIFLSPSVMVFYITNTVVGRSEFYAYDYQIFIKSVIVVLGQIFFCFESENLNNLV
ncbi:uncharacterized protein BDFB_010910, partial [Asbolus verrucosus]